MASLESFWFAEKLGICVRSSSNAEPIVWTRVRSRAFATSRRCLVRHL